jgi:hypothetical protein
MITYHNLDELFIRRYSHIPFSSVATVTTTNFCGILGGEVKAADK